MGINFKVCVAPTRSYSKKDNTITIECVNLSDFDLSKHYVYHHYIKGKDKPFYVGKGTGRRIVSSDNRNYHWLNIADKHECYAKIIKGNMTGDESIILEKEEILKYGRLDNNTGILVNMTDGGDGLCGRIMPDEEKAMRSDNMSGEGNHMFGVQLFGKMNGNYGNRYGANPISISVVCLTLDGEFVKKYESINSTELDGFNPSSVGMCCNKRRPQHMNYMFIFESDYINNDIPVYKRGVTSKRKVVGVSYALKSYKVYESAQETKKDGFRPTNVNQCCNKTRKTHANYEWYFIEEINLELLRYSLANSESC